MALTIYLKAKSSSVYRWMEAFTDRQEISAIVKEVNNLLQEQPIISPSEDIDTSVLRYIGTAFDYGFRWLLGPLEAKNIVAIQGAQRFPQSIEGIAVSAQEEPEPGLLRASIMRGVVLKTVEKGNSS